MPDIDEKRTQLVIQWMVPYAMQAVMMLYYQQKDTATAGRIDWAKLAVYLVATYVSTKTFFDLSL